MAKQNASAVEQITILAHLRWVAALVVVLSHIEQEILNKGGYSPPRSQGIHELFTKPVFAAHGYGHAAVIIFFVLSGFLVGGKLSELIQSQNIDQEWPKFLLDRFVRIFIVLWPALLLTATVCTALVWLLPGAPFVQTGNWTFDLSSPMTADLSLTRWIGAATLLNELIVPTLDTNGPLWSLAYEWFYYILALAGVLLYRRRAGCGALSIIVYGVLLLAISLINQPDIPTSGLSWGAGWLARVAFERRLLTGLTSFAAGIAIVLLVLVFDARHPTSDPILGLTLAFMISHDIWSRWNWGAVWGQKLANFSYSLYAIHFPMLLAFIGLLYGCGALQHRLKFNGVSLTACILALGLLILCARGFAFLTEERTSSLKKILQRIILG